MNKFFLLLYPLLLMLGCSVNLDRERGQLQIHDGQKLIVVDRYSFLIDLDGDYPVLIVLEEGNIIHGIDLEPGKSRVATHRYDENLVKIFFDSNGDGVLDGYHESKKQ